MLIMLLLQKNVRRHKTHICRRSQGDQLIRWQLLLTDVTVGFMQRFFEKLGDPKDEIVTCDSPGI